MFEFAPVLGASVTAQFQVIARVIDSCTVSAAAIAMQSASANETITVNCQNSVAPASSSGSAGEALTSGTANVHYSVEDVPGRDGGLRIITVHF